MAFLMHMRAAMLALATAMAVCPGAGADPQENDVKATLLKNRRVRFDVNLRAVERAGLFVSSRLLRVARSVESVDQ